MAKRTQLRGLVPPSIASIRKKFAVNVPDMMEALWQPIYDYTAYAATGQTQLTFFANPVGQAGKTDADTNMEGAGQLPAPKSFLLMGISIDFYSGVVPGTYGAAAAGAYVNDVHTVMKSGYLRLKIGSKQYLQDAPLGKFPPDHGMEVGAALSDTTTAAASGQSMIQFARMSGGIYEISPEFIPQSQNFSVTLNWPTVVALPSTVAGRIGVTLHGFEYRQPQ